MEYLKGFADLIAKMMGVDINDELSLAFLSYLSVKILFSRFAIVKFQAIVTLILFAYLIKIIFYQTLII